jgi:hypothetical protein
MDGVMRTLDEIGRNISRRMRGLARKHAEERAQVQVAATTCWACGRVHDIFEVCASQGEINRLIQMIEPIAMADDRARLPKSGRKLTVHPSWAPTICRTLDEIGRNISWFCNTHPCLHRPGGRLLGYDIYWRKVE